MKTLFLGFLLTLASFASKAQDFVVDVYQVDILSYNTISEQFEMYQTSYPNGMQIAKRGDVLSVSNQDGSRYRIGEQLKSDNSHCVNFMATDKDFVDIGLQVCMYESEKKATVTILYLEKMVVVYYVKP